MTRYEKYLVEKNWKNKVKKAEKNMEIRKELHQEKVRNKVYSFGLFLFGIGGSIIVKDVTPLIFTILGIATWKENAKLEINQF